MDFGGFCSLSLYIFFSSRPFTMKSIEAILKAICTVLKQWGKQNVSIDYFSPRSINKLIAAFFLGIFQFFCELEKLIDYLNRHKILISCKYIFIVVTPKYGAKTVVFAWKIHTSSIVVWPSKYIIYSLHSTKSSLATTYTLNCDVVNRARVYVYDNGNHSDNNRENCVYIHWAKLK